MGRSKTFSALFGIVLVLPFLAGITILIPGGTPWVRIEPGRTAFAQAASPDSQTPAEAEINLQDVGSRLWNQANFQYTYDRWLPEDKSWHAWGTMVSAPRSWAVYSPVRESQFLLGVIRIADRYWWGVENVTWTSFSESEVASNQADETTLLAWWLLNTADLELHALFPDQRVKLTGDVISIEGIPCYRYTWQQPEARTGGSLFLHTTTLLPVQIEHRQGDDVALRVQFHHINDPSSVIHPPVLTQELTMSDVRMALNTLPVFRWAAHWMVLPEQPGIEHTSLDLTDDGIYSLTDHAQWVWTHMERSEEARSATLFLVWQEGYAKAWASANGHSPWLEWTTELDAFFSAFYLWTLDIHVVGTLVSPTILEIDEFACREYLFEQTDAPSPETPSVSQTTELRLCVTDNRVPVRAQLRVTIQNVATGEGVTFLEGEWVMARMNDADDSQTMRQAIQSLPSRAALSFPQIQASSPGIATESPVEPGGSPPTESPKPTEPSR